MAKLRYREKLETKITLSFLLIIILIVGILSGVMYRQNYKLLVNNLGKRSVEIAETAATKIKIDEFKKLKTIDDEKKEIYHIMRKELNYIREISGAKYIYTVRKNEDGNYVYVVDGMDYENISHIGDIEEEVTLGYTEAAKGKIYIGEKIDITEWGTLISSFYPLKDNNGEVVGFVGVDYDVEAEYKEFQKMKQTIILISLVLLILTSILGVFLLKRITKPIEAIAETANKVANYDLTIKNINVKSKDEIGQLSQAFNKMGQNLRQLINHITNIAENLGASSQQMAASAEQSTAMADQMTQTVDKLTKGAIEEAATVEQTSITINQMADSIQQVAVNAQRASEAGKNATESAGKGQQAVDKAVQTMDGAQRVMKEAVRSTQSLGENSKEIGNIVQIITGIADQTNLLALNAAIEAARAGEQGRGFAVVAEEVRKLAEESSNAAGQIAQLIDEVQKGTNTAVDLMNKGARTVEEGSHAVVETGKVFDEIHMSIDQIATVAEEVSVTTQQMSAGSEQIVAAMDNIATIADESAAGAQQASSATQEQMASIEEIASSAQNLAQMAEELQKQIGQFKI